MIQWAQDDRPPSPTGRLFNLAGRVPVPLRGARLWLCFKRAWCVGWKRRVARLGWWKIVHPVVIRSFDGRMSQEQRLNRGGETDAVKRFYGGGIRG